MMVYIEEAHAVDEWPVRSGRFVPGGIPVSVEQPKTTNERLGICTEFLQTMGLPKDGELKIAVDGPEEGNLFEKAYAPWPVRMFVIEDGTMQFISAPTECSHNVGELREWLEERFK